MKLKEYIESLVTLIEERPETLEMEVVYAIDDEGNAFHSVWSGPTIGAFIAPDFHSEANVAEEPDEYEEYGDMTPNSVCIN